jgi:hypothetical protein
MSRHSAAKKIEASHGDYVVERIGKDTVLLLRPLRASVLETTRKLTADRRPIRGLKKK